MHESSSTGAWTSGSTSTRSYARAQTKVREYSALAAAHLVLKLSADLCVCRAQEPAGEGREGEGEAAPRHRVQEQQHQRQRHSGGRGGGHCSCYSSWRRAPQHTRAEAQGAVDRRPRVRAAGRARRARRHGRREHPRARGGHESQGARTRVIVCEHVRSVFTVTLSRSCCMHTECSVRGDRSLPHGGVVLLAVPEGALPRRPHRLRASTSLASVVVLLLLA